MKANRKRDISEYGKGNKIDIFYLEGYTFKDLSPEHYLTIGMAYNFTGKNTHTFITRT